MFPQKSISYGVSQEFEPDFFALCVVAALSCHPPSHLSAFGFLRDFCCVCLFRKNLVCSQSKIIRFWCTPNREAPAHQSLLISDFRLNKNKRGLQFVICKLRFEIRQNRFPENIFCKKVARAVASPSSQFTRLRTLFHAHCVYVLLN